MVSYYLNRKQQNFYPRPPGGGRHNAVSAVPGSAQFLSTPSGWRATCAGVGCASKSLISIHALRVEGDATFALINAPGDAFLSTPSGWRATARGWATLSTLLYFYPRPPGGGRQRRRLAWLGAL